MAISKYPIKINHIECLFKIVNDSDASATVTLGLATDILKSNETLDGRPPTVNIGALEAALSDLSEVTITRNGKVVLTLFENSSELEMGYGADNENNTYDIVVTLSSKGTLIMRLLKLQGYKANFQPENTHY